MKAIYLRKSRQGEEHDALATHRSVLVRMCEQNGWEYEIFEEIVSGADNKPELDKIRNNLDKYDGVLCMDIDRLSRDKVEAFQLELEFAAVNVKVFTPNQTYDFADESQNMMYSFKAVFANAELKKIKARMKAGKINKFKNGEYTIGKPPLGYKIQNKRLEVDEENAKIVRQIFELSTQGLGREAISDATGIGSGNIRHILKNTAYIGQVEYNIGTEVVTQTCDPIVDIELFVKVQEEVKRRYNAPVRTRGEIRSIVQGLVRCLLCGNQMPITKNGILRCNTPKCKQSGIKVEVIEKHICERMEQLEWTATDILVERLEHATPNTIGTEITTLQGQIEGLKSKLERVKEAYFEGDIDKAEFKEKKSNLDQQLSDMLLKLKALELKKAREEDSDVSLLQSMIEDLQRFESVKDVTERHNIVKRVVDRIDYNRNVTVSGRNRRGIADEFPPTLEVKYRV